ncbi:MAG: hypothetical protein COB67_11540, partial [SAR324 cluster bacterium]
QTKKNTPAMKMLLELGVPLEEQLRREITSMIELEKIQGVSLARKQLFALMADYRANLEIAVADLRDFLLTGDQSFEREYQKRWENTAEDLRLLQEKKSLFTAEQLKYFNQLLLAEEKFEDLAAEILAIRRSPQWNLSNYWSSSRAAPIAFEIKDILTVIVKNQQALIQEDFATYEAQTTLLIVIEGILFIVGISIAIFLSLFVTRSITAPIGNLLEATKRLAAGDLSQEVEKFSEDEIGELSSLFNHMMAQLKQRNQLVEEGTARTQGVVNTAVDGIIMIDGLGKVEGFNPAAELLFGYRAEEVLGENIKMLMPSPFTLEHDGYLDRYHRTGIKNIIGIGREVVGKRKNGSTFPFFLSIGELKLGEKTFFSGIIRDLTEEKKAQEKLKQSESKNRGIVETAVDAIIMINHLGAIEAFNPAAERLFGYVADEVRGKNLKMLMPSPYHEEHDSYLERYNRTGVKKIIGMGREVTGKHKLGSTFPIFLSIGEIRMGEQLLFTGIIRDIKKTKEAEQELRARNQEMESQNWLKTQLAKINSLSQGVQDLRSLAQLVISELAKMLEVGHGVFYTKKEDHKLTLLGSYAYQERRNISRSFKLGEGLVGQCALEKQPILLTQVPADYVRILSGLGEKAPMNILVIPILYEDDCVGVIELSSFHAFTQLQQDLLVQIAATLGVTINVVLGRQRIEELLAESQQQTEELQTQSEELQTANEELEEKAEAMDRQTMELKASNEELSEKGKALEAQKNYIEQKNADIEEKAKDLALASKYKSEFLANMSHELRTPLNSLLILAESLASNEEDNLTEDQVESAQVIHNGGLELLNLINDILDLSKVEAGHLQMTIEKVEIKSILSNLKSQFNPLAAQNKLTLNFNLAPELPLNFQTDKQRTEQIIKNLLSNALKFTEVGEVNLDVHLPRSGVRFRDDSLQVDSTLAFSIRDTGIGIPLDKQKAIFEAFQQADGSISRKFRGTGLGLTISRELARLLHGEIQMVSEEGKGSTFTLYLPLRQSPSLLVEAAVMTKVLPEVKEPIKKQPEFPYIPDDRWSLRKDEAVILIIEDDPQFAKILLDCIHKKRYKGLVAGDGTSGLALAAEYSPVAIMLDLGLPDIDGGKVMDNLKKNIDTRHIPIHVISGKVDEFAPLPGGAVCYLTKPVKATELDIVFSKIQDRLEREIKEILVVEDNLMGRKAISTLLENKGVKLITVGTGTEALQAIKQQKYDLMILDLGLPDMKGEELLKKLDEDPTLVLPPVVVYTGKDLTQEEYEKLNIISESVVIKGSDSPTRLLDEVSLFLHSLKPKLSKSLQSSPNYRYSKHTFEGKKILLVDDDMRNTFALSKALQKFGLTVIKAGNGQLALEQLDRVAGIDLVIMDIMMPVMDGYEATRQIRQRKAFQTLPIIALTAKAMPEDRIKCLEAGANDYLTKPVNMEKLISMINIWLFEAQ